jgi:hypothetical protein
MSGSNDLRQLGGLSAGTDVHTLTGLIFTIVAQRPETQDVYVQYHDTGSTEHVDARSPVRYNEQLHRWEMGRDHY